MWKIRRFVLQCTLCVLPTDSVNNMNVTAHARTIDMVQDSSILLKLQATQKLWSSEEHVQSWIENSCIPSTTGACKEVDKSFSDRQSSLDSDVFLQIPAAHGDGDDLELGAEAKHFSSNSHHYQMISPRLSPMGSCDERELEQNDGSFLGDNSAVHELASTSPIPSEDEIKVLLVSGSTGNNKKPSIHSEVFEDTSLSRKAFSKGTADHKRLEKGYSLDSYTTYDSFASSFDRPSSLAAALRANAEDMLFSLGFGGDSSLLQSIPARFFQQPSAAYGIDVDEIHRSLLEDQDYEEFEQPFDSTDSNPIHHPRFSQSSIDLSMSSVSADSKRILFQSAHHDVPSIYVSQEENERPNTPTTTSGSIGLNFMKLETLEELPEPASRSNSFDNDRRASFTDTLNTLADKIQSLVSRKTSNDSQRRQSERKYSDASCSRVDTLTDENVNDNKNNLETEPFKREVLSSKSSLNTIIHVDSLEDEIKKITAVNTPSDACDNENSIKLKRRLFSKTRSERVNDVNEENDQQRNLEKFSDEKQPEMEINDNLETETNNNIEMKNEKSSLVEKTNSFENSMEESLKEADKMKNNKTFNGALKEFFKRLKHQSISDESQYKPVNIQVVLTPPDESEKSLILTLDNDGNEVVHELPNKKSYISSAFSAISNIITSHKNDHKNGKTLSFEPDNIEGSVTDMSCDAIDRSRDQQIENKTQTSFVKSSINENSKNDLYTGESTFKKGEKNSTGETLVNNEHGLPNNLESKSNSCEDLFEEFKSTSKTHVNSFERFRKLSDPTFKSQQNSDSLSTEKLSKITSKSLVNIFHMSNHSHSPFDSFISNKLNKKAKNNEVIKQNHKILDNQSTQSEPKIKNIRHGISNSIDDLSSIKCPLGKNCTLSHCHSDVLRNRTNSTTSSSVRSVPIAHDHFEYLLQQLNSLRNEMRKEFEMQTIRQETLVIGLCEKLTKAYSGGATDHASNEDLIHQLEGLKQTIKEKDDEIIRLNNILKQTSTNMH